jgi:hypothetical protein
MRRAGTKGRLYDPGEDGWNKQSFQGNRRAEAYEKIAQGKAAVPSG